MTIGKVLCEILFIWTYASVWASLPMLGWNRYLFIIAVSAVNKSSLHLNDLRSTSLKSDLYLSAKLVKLFQIEFQQFVFNILRCTHTFLRYKLFASRYVPEGNMTACGTDYLSKSWASKSYILVYSFFVYFVPLFTIIGCYYHIISVSYLKLF